ncbi:C-C motif chemokine 27 isoform X1 [Panthera tigris]|uniref:C-C motif chemokine 27 isoform X1 n=1 Tax=Panthera tigris TaxID=9694 RepID=UPI00042C23F7|nr:C-C motif chemokine 27 isoform X1 [Panthera tigris]
MGWRERDPGSPSSSCLIEGFGVRSPLNTWPHCPLALLLSPSITCCTQLYRQPLSNKLLRKVIRVELQEADGDCHLQAFVLHLSRRSVCIHPQNRSLARWFERQGRRFQGILPNLNLELIEKMDQGP